ncbi:MAG TPA: anion permease [Tepidisphaeraceae bacterium]|nr:anion permease [Tepidisphaeraceae bacterium]
MLTLIFVIVFVALVFDFLNGFHDAANSIATIVSTRVLSPGQAVAWAAFFNFVAAFVFGTAVSETISKGLVDPAEVDIWVVFGGLMGAIIWNIITWLLGLPTSSSHALVAGLAGAAITKSGIGVLIWPGKWRGILMFIFLGPIIGLLVGAGFMVAMAWIFRRATPHKVDTAFRRLQLFSAAIFSLAHGGNDAQKTMGIIVMLLTAANLKGWTQPSPHSWFEQFFAFLHRLAGDQIWLHRTIEFFHHEHSVAWWVILLCHFAIGLGTLFGGWRIVKTMGSSITRLAPVGGFCAESGAAATIIAATHFGIPISTTHAITGSIIGVGTVRSVRSVRWIWGQRIVMAWILTIPCSAFMAAIAYGLIRWLVAPLVGQ